MKRLQSALVAIGVATAVLAACSSGSPSPSRSPSPSTTPSATPVGSPTSTPSGPPQPTPSATATATGPGEDEALVDTEWLLVMVGDGAISPEPPITIAFGSDGQANGSGGCNSYGGTYQLNGAGITFGPLLSTKMACVDPVINQNENAFFAALALVQAWSVEAGRLTLSGPGGTDPLIFEAGAPIAPPEGVVGPTWLVTRLGETDLPADAGLTATFGEDGIVYGSAGCNEYSGAYELDGGALTFGGLATTDMACAGEVGAREASFHQAVAAVAGWKLEGGQLQLLDSNGVAIIWLTPTR